MSMGDIKVNINTCIAIKPDMQMYRYSSHYNSKLYNQYFLLKKLQPAHVTTKFIKNLLKSIHFY